MRKIISSLIVQGYHRLQPWLETLEEEAAAERGSETVRGVCPFPVFLSRLVEETERAGRYELQLGLLVVQVPWTPTTKRRRHALEIALRDCLRKPDIPGRLSEDLLAVVLPETGRGTPAAAERIGQLLSRVAEAPVSVGFARYPEDGLRAPDLLRIATERSTGPCPPVSALWGTDGAGEAQPACITAT